MVLISRSTSLPFQDESMATLPINPASFNRTLKYLRDMGIGFVMTTAGGRQNTFLEYILFLGVAWRLFLAVGGTLAFLEKEDGRGKRFYREITEEKN